MLRAGQQFDVVLTDIEMPDMNGFEFAEAIRADPRTATMPIIALSSLVSPAAIERGRQAGFHDFVAKFDRPGLIAALKEQTARRQPGGVRTHDDGSEIDSAERRSPNTSPR